MDSEAGWVLVRRHPNRYWTSLQRLAGFLHQLSTCLAPAARPQPCYMHACMPHPGHRPRASPGSARPGVGITPSFTADGVVPGCTLHSEARVMPDPPLCAGYRIAYIAAQIRESGVCRGLESGSIGMGTVSQTLANGTFGPTLTKLPFAWLVNQSSSD